MAMWLGNTCIWGKGRNRVRVEREGERERERVGREEERGDREVIPHESQLESTLTNLLVETQICRLFGPHGPHSCDQGMLVRGCLVVICNSSTLDRVYLSQNPQIIMLEEVTPET